MLAHTPTAVAYDLNNNPIQIENTLKGGNRRYQTGVSSLNGNLQKSDSLRIAQKQSSLPSVQYSDTKQAISIRES
jgi:hypothetical protein